MSLSSDEEKMNVTGAKRAAPVESQGRCGKVRENRMMGKQIQREKKKRLDGMYATEQVVASESEE